MLFTNLVSTHRRAEAAACRSWWSLIMAFNVSTHSRAEAAAYIDDPGIIVDTFQHTAARRRLLRWVRYTARTLRFNTQPRGGGCWLVFELLKWQKVSTHSRAEAAATTTCASVGETTVSTHSRAEAAAFDDL